ncbi:glycosyltransferase family 2 protein [Lacticigenium naphthae]|uniref:glycosyltransferase family 2 protein n=1 Tax=Lacticigenium naphthae TaxID=515351 RepID=UPI000403727A|nr:glycosyltransferase family 2 protein [Lacticigenium naphthae]
MKTYTVVIPAYRPTDDLLRYIEKLKQGGVSSVFVINDGSGHAFDGLFNQIKKDPICTYVEHEMNQGKGAALKTAFRYILKAEKNTSGVVTVDADGQHAVKDVIRIGELLKRKQDGIIIGMRDFKTNNVPLNSFIGNTVTSRFFQMLFGFLIRDTQTGLRGIPVNELERMIELRGDRYEYEMNMLIHAARRGIPIRGVEIETIYTEHRVSYYNSFVDSIKIFLQMIKGYFKEFKEKK